MGKFMGDSAVINDGTRAFGAVGYAYQMGEYDATAAQYCRFLNAVAADDTNGLYNANMANRHRWAQTTLAAGSFAAATPAATLTM
jgi:hypothetical protein